MYIHQIVNEFASLNHANILCILTDYVP